MTFALTIGGNVFSGLPGSSFSSSSSSFRLKNSRPTVICSSSSLMDSYKTLRIQPDSSEYEVKKAFRQLAKKYHRDVCRGSNCGVHFQTINEAYDQIKNQMEGTDEFEPFDVSDEGFTGMNDPDCDTWEEWMGWEGAGSRDHSSHVNPFA